MTSHALASFWKCYEQLPVNIQKLADKQFALFKANPRHRVAGLPQERWGLHRRDRSELSRISSRAKRSLLLVLDRHPLSNTISSSSKCRPVQRMAFFVALRPPFGTLLQSWPPKRFPMGHGMRSSSRILTPTQVVRLRNAPRHGRPCQP